MGGGMRRMGVCKCGHDSAEHEDDCCDGNPSTSEICSCTGFREKEVLVGKQEKLGGL
ncbi:MAG: hypothetical protein Q8R15_00750 [Candidatus Micrarchaeota archaeon]|nr:hypothetical protein [Candidatus Micrarchaeota archaeon]